jgi:hypothetical protein
MDLYIHDRNKTIDSYVNTLLWLKTTSKIDDKGNHHSVQQHHG